MKNASARVRLCLRWGGLALLTVVAAVPLCPPEAPDAGAGETGFSTERALAHVAVLAAEPHPMGSPAIARVREYLVDALDGAGLEVWTQAVEAPDWFGGSGRAIEIVNVVGRIPGRDSTGALLFVAHYDTVPTTPGANDNSACVAVLLEAARALSSDTPVRNDVVFLLTDGEEPAPKYGARAFVEHHPWSEDVAFVVNLEAAGSTGASMLAETCGPERWLVDTLADASEAPVAFSYATESTALIGEIGTDFDVFKAEHLPGLHFAYMHGSPIYHTLADDVASVGPSSLGQHAAHVLGLARRLGGKDLRQIPSTGGANYFTVGDRWVIRYPDALALALAALAVILLAFVLVRDARAGRRTVGALFGGTALAFAVFLGVAVASGLAWALLAGARPDPGLLESYGYLVGLLLVFGWVAVFLLRTRRTGAPPPAGVVVVWSLFALAAATWAPGFGYLFAWPALAGALLLATSSSTPAWQRGLARWGVAVAVVLLHLPFVDFVFQFAQPRPGNPDSQVLAIAGLAVAVAALSIAQLHQAFSRARG